MGKKYLPATFRVPKATTKIYHSLAYPGMDDVEPYAIDDIALPKSIVSTHKRNNIIKFINFF